MPKCRAAPPYTCEARLMMQHISSSTAVEGIGLFCFIRPSNTEMTISISSDELMKSNSLCAPGSTDINTDISAQRVCHAGDAAQRELYALGQKAQWLRHGPHEQPPVVRLDTLHIVALGHRLLCQGPDAQGPQVGQQGAQPAVRGDRVRHRSPCLIGEPPVVGGYRIAPGKVRLRVGERGDDGTGLYHVRILYGKDRYL